MRIRKSASRLLGSAYSASAAPAPAAEPTFELPSPPPQHLAPCSAPESRCGGGFTSPVTASAESCELSRSPWDLIAELALSDPQVEDDLVDKYFVSVSCRASWLFAASMPAASVKKEKPIDDREYSATQPRHEAPKKVVAMDKEKARKEISGAKKMTKVKKEEEEDEKKARAVWKCKKNDGKGWQCHRKVRRANTLCKYHFEQKRSYLNPEFAAAMAALPPPPAAAPSKPATSSKPRKKKASDDSSATEGFYYYAGFGPFRSKRQCRSTGMNEPLPVKQEEEEERPPEDASNQQDQAADRTNSRRAAAHDDKSSCDGNIAGIAGGDEESSDDDYRLGGTPGRNANGGGEHRGVGNGDGKRKTPWKRWRKPVKARSLKSLM